jgi:hypothetical protein
MKLSGSKFTIVNRSGFGANKLLVLANWIQQILKPSTQIQRMTDLSVPVSTELA